MLSFFEPVVTKIIALLSHQIERARKADSASKINVKHTFNISDIHADQYSVSFLLEASAIHLI